MREVSAISAGSRMRAIAVAVLAAIVTLTALAAAPGADAKPKKKKKAVPVKVMTRNIFLGADLGPALNAGSFEEFIEANGQILREADETNFPLRAEGLADEIAGEQPHLVGLQEVAWWRTSSAPYIGFAHGAQQNPAFTATTTKYDFLQNLMDELEARGADYEVAVEKPEFDFEGPTDYNNVDDDAPASMGGGDGTNDESDASFDDAEIMGRLTMRDVILVKDSKKVKYKNPSSGTFQNLYTPNIAGIDLPVTRGWTAVDAQVQKGKGKKKVKKKFRFVNSHFEAFDDETQRPSIRALQAQELTSKGGQYGEGPGAARRTIMLGDFNSDVPGVKQGDDQAFQTILDAGFRDIGVEERASCCVSDLFTAPPSEFDHRVDHVVTNIPKKKLKRTKAEITGREQTNGIYNSDHAGVISTLKLK